MRFLKLIWRYKISIITFMLVFFLAGYFITDYVYNQNQARYLYMFTSEKEDMHFLLEEAYYNSVFEKIEENNQLAETDSSYKKISYAKIDYQEMLKTAQLTTKDNQYEFSIKKKYFPSVVSSSTGKVNVSENRVKNYFNLILSYAPEETTFKEVLLTGNVNPWGVGAVSATLGFLLILGCMFRYSIKRKDYVEIEDNTIVFTSIFHKKYWHNSLDFTHSVKKMCMVSVLFGCMLICKLLPIPSGFGSLGISFTYLFFAVIAMIYGPVCGLFIGFCSDILGYFIQPGGVFFLGYTLDAMLAGFIYGICFYKKRITFMNCLVARTFVNLFVNVGLGGLWWKTLYQLDWDAYLTYISLTSLPKNILYLLPQSIVLFIFFKAVSKPLASFGLIDEKIKENIRLF